MQMHITVLFDIINSSDWWDEKFSIEADTIENARAQAIQMANTFELAHHIQCVTISLPDGERHYCFSGNMDRTTFRKILPPDFGPWYVIPADNPRKR